MAVPAPINPWLLASAVLDAAAAGLHIAIIFAGAPWYRFFGAGERMARLAEAGSWRPAIVTAGIAVVLILWSAYALSGAAAIGELFGTKWVLAVVTAIYAVRGLVIVPIVLLDRPHLTPFLVWSSLVCLAFGAVHLIGTWQVWQRLGSQPA